MAVKVWLPLSSDISTNYGVTEVSTQLNVDSETEPVASFGAGILGGGAINFAAYILEIGSLTISNKFSVAFWVKEGASVSVNTPLFSFNSNSGSVAKCVKTADGYAIPELASGTLFTLNAGWNHVAITADGTTVKAFVNGVQSEAGDVTQLANVNTATTFIIGGSRQVQASSIELWTGNVSNLKIYDDVLSLFEIVKEAEALVLNYSFNAATSLGTGVTLPSGTTASDFGFGDKEYDLSGNGFDGAFTAPLPTGSTDTAMYSTSTDFTNAGGVASAAINTSAFVSRYTVSVWAKGTGSVLSIGSWAPITANDASAWHLYTVANGVLYIDGEATDTSISGSMPSNSVAVTVGSNFSGKISDLRIFAKALSADEVKALYSRKAAIDDSGKVIASEFVVNDEVTAPAFSKAGVISSVDLANVIGDSENETFNPVTKFAIYQSSGAVNATDIIEY